MADKKMTLAQYSRRVGQVSQPDGAVKDYAAILAKYELPELPGTVIGARRITRLDDWYVQTADGWYWLDARNNKWVFSPMGPIE